MREWRYSFSILDLGTRSTWVVSFTPRPLYLLYQLNRSLRKWSHTKGCKDIAPMIVNLGTMEVSGQLHAPAALPRRKQPLVFIGIGDIYIYIDLVYRYICGRSDSSGCSLDYRVQFHVWARGFCHLHNVQSGSWGPPSLLCNGCRGPLVSMYCRG
jgi:hypothetical protein